MRRRCAMGVVAAALVASCGTGRPPGATLPAQPVATAAGSFAPAPPPATGVLARNVLEDAGLRGDLEAEGVTGVVVAFDPDGGVLVASDPAKSRVRHVPASTFKIANATVAFETGAVAGPDAIVPWDGVVRSRPEWNRDQSLRDAFRTSCVPCFAWVAARVGEPRMREWLSRLDYGNRDTSGGPLFWLRGSLRISALEQIDFLHRLDTGRLPIRPVTRARVVSVLRMEERDGRVLYGKTGHANPPDEPELVAWFVGWVERGRRRLYFATVLDGAGPGVSLANARRSVTDRVLRRLGAA